MMEVEHISYIFGSFARRRQSQEVTVTQSNAINSSKINHDRSKSAPHTSKKVELPLPRARSVCNYVYDGKNFKCTFCRDLYVEPRVLPCLHTFCTACLQKLERDSDRLELQGKSYTYDHIFIFLVKLNIERASLSEKEEKVWANNFVYGAYLIS